jgi:hypothetical protein
MCGIWVDKQPLDHTGDATTLTPMPLYLWWTLLTHSVLQLQVRENGKSYFVFILLLKHTYVVAEELHQMLAEDELRDAALLVFANKQDLPGTTCRVDYSYCC